MVFALPNLLTLVRVPLAISLWLQPRSELWLLLILAVAGATDVFDGRVARALRRRRASGAELVEQEAVGAWLDPVCDKLFAVSALAVLWFGFGAQLSVILLAATRELVIAPLVVLYHVLPNVRERLQVDFHADWIGKLTTTLQFGVVAAILFAPAIAMPLAVVTAITGVIAAAHYVHRGLHTASRRA